MIVSRKKPCSKMQVKVLVNLFIACNWTSARSGRRNGRKFPALGPEGQNGAISAEFGTTRCSICNLWVMMACWNQIRPGLKT